MLYYERYTLKKDDRKSSEESTLYSFILIRRPTATGMGYKPFTTGSYIIATVGMCHKPLPRKLYHCHCSNVLQTITTGSYIIATAGMYHKPLPREAISLPLLGCITNHYHGKLYHWHCSNVSQTITTEAISLPLLGCITNHYHGNLCQCHCSNVEYITGYYHGKLYDCHCSNVFCCCCCFVLFFFCLFVCLFVCLFFVCFFFWISRNCTSLTAAHMTPLYKNTVFLVFLF